MRAWGLAVVLVVAGCGSAAEPRLGTPHLATPSAQSAEQQAANDTRAENARLLGLVTLPQGTTPAAAAQVPILSTVQHPADDNLVDFPEFFTVPLSVDATQAYYAAHPPAGLTASGSGSSGGPGGEAYLLTFEDKDSGDFSGPTLLLSFAPFGGQTAMRVDAQTIEVHPHDPAEQVPDGVTTAIVSTNKGKSATLTADQAQALATLLNGLKTSGGGARGCLADTGLRLTATFTASGLTFTLNPACSSVAVTLRGEPEPGYDSNADLEPLLLEDVGLPANYSPTS